MQALPRNRSFSSLRHEDGSPSFHYIQSVQRPGNGSTGHRCSGELYDSVGKGQPRGQPRELAPYRTSVLQSLGSRKRMGLLSRTMAGRVHPATSDSRTWTPRVGCELAIPWRDEQPMPSTSSIDTEGHGLEDSPSTRLVKEPSAVVALQFGLTT